MNLPIEFWICATAFTAGPLGYLAAALMHGVKRSRIERQTWNSARLFYTRREDSKATRL